MPAIAAAMPDVSDADLMPLDYMLRVIRDPSVDESRRDRLAVAAAPYCHSKMGEGGKKDKETERADDAASQFAARTPPRLVASKP